MKEGWTYVWNPFNRYRTDSENLLTEITRLKAEARKPGTKCAVACHPHATDDRDDDPFGAQEKGSSSQLRDGLFAPRNAITPSPEESKIADGDRPAWNQSRGH